MEPLWHGSQPRGSHPRPGIYIEAARVAEPNSTTGLGRVTLNVVDALALCILAGDCLYCRPAADCRELTDAGRAGAATVESSREVGRGLRVRDVDMWPATCEEAPGLRVRVLARETNIELSQADIDRQERKSP